MLASLSLLLDDICVGNAVIPVGSFVLSSLKRAEGSELGLADVLNDGSSEGICDGVDVDITVGAKLGLVGVHDGELDAGMISLSESEGILDGISNRGKIREG